MVLMPALILWYLSSDDVKVAFGEAGPGDGGSLARGTQPTNGM